MGIMRFIALHAVGYQTLKIAYTLAILLHQKKLLRKHANTMTKLMVAIIAALRHILPKQIYLPVCFYGQVDLVGGHP
jgi:hypothetical protein